MKVLAQSEVPSSPQYLHLGYLSATVTERGKSVFPGGALMLTGILIATRLRRLRLPGKATQYQFQGSQSLARLGVGWAIVAVGLGLVIVGWASPRVRYQSPWFVSESRSRSIAAWIGSLAREGKPIPATSRDLATREFLAWYGDEKLHDGWFHDFQIDRVARANGTSDYCVRSAGPDGAFGTDDDLQAYASEHTDPPEAEPPTGPHGAAPASAVAGPM